MNWLARMFSGVSGTQAKGLSPVDRILALQAGRTLSGSGTQVTWGTALEVTTVLACARVIAEGLAQVPFRLYRDAPRHELATDHPLYDLLYRQPNSWQTSFEFRETIALHLVLTNNAFVWKGRVGSDRRLASLEPLEPGRECTVRRSSDGRLIYSGTRDGSSVTYAPDEIWHIRGPSWNSWCGIDAVRLLREAIGLAQATEASQADFHEGGARVSGLLSVAGTMSTDRFKQLSAWLDLYEQGGERAGKPFILDNDAKFSTMQMSGVDAQHLETRKFQIEEICRGFRVMPLMVGYTDKTSTYASVEQMLIAHVTHTMMPWYARIEQSADVNLLSEMDRRAGIYSKFNANALMRGAAKDRAEFYSKALGAGGTPAWMTQDEIRGLEELDPRGGAADELSQGAMNKPAPASTGG